MASFYWFWTSRLSESMWWKFKWIFIVRSFKHQSLSFTVQGLCCLMTPGLIKDIQCHVWLYLFLHLQITSLDIRPHIKCLNGFNLVLSVKKIGLLCKFMWVFMVDLWTHLLEDHSVYYANQNWCLGFEHQEDKSVMKLYMGFRDHFLDTFTGISECTTCKFKWVYWFGVSRILNVM